jgi:hypothetical protein
MAKRGLCVKEGSDTAAILISGLLISIGKTSREALISKEATKFVAKISVNLRHISSSEFWP